MLEGYETLLGILYCILKPKSCQYKWLEIAQTSYSYGFSGPLSQEYTQVHYELHGIFKSWVPLRI